MGEQEVNYTSVVFKNNNRSQTEAKKEEEAVYDEVKVRSETTEQTGDTNVSTGSLLDKTANNGRHHCRQLAICAGIACVVLLLGVIAVCVYQSKITSLTAENQQLKSQNQQLETQRSNLTEQIRDMETKWNKLNVSRAQWSINAYCRKKRCEPCQKGWEYSEPSCYAINDARPGKQKTWDKAQENCRGKISDLADITSQKEKEFISSKSWQGVKIQGYWIGLRVEDGKWKWVDGSDLTENSWIKLRPTHGHCAISVPGKGLDSMNCGSKNAWICKKMALSISTNLGRFK